MTLKLVTIKSNQQCLSFLKRASGNGEVDIEQGKNLLVKPWFEKIANLVEPFEKAMVAQLHAHARRAEEIAARNKVVTTMKHTVRDFRSALMRRVRRNGEPEVVLQYYRMPHERKPVYDDDWYQLGQWLLDGEATALGKGFPAMTNPTADELTASLDAFAELRGNAEEADRRYRDVQDVLVDLRKETQLVARGLAANFRVLLHDKDAPTIRRIMRSYGFRFRDRAEEAPEEATVSQEPAGDREIDEVPTDAGESTAADKNESRTEEVMNESVLKEPDVPDEEYIDQKSADPPDRKTERFINVRPVQRGKSPDNRIGWNGQVGEPGQTGRKQTAGNGIFLNPDIPPDHRMTNH
ncbi:MAG: hypothetical protein QNK37_31035 [Acidobacteriota bacterium]|nr:hypothetical protein [Acidobacteriota bacterium]